MRDALPHPKGPVPQARRWSYGATVQDFVTEDPAVILGQLTAGSAFADELSQKNAWVEEARLLAEVLAPYRKVQGALYLEYDIPRLGRRIDAVLILEHVVFVLEFKVGETRFSREAVEQVWDYALDLKNFHEPSHDVPLVPILVATHSDAPPESIKVSKFGDLLANPLRCGAQGLREALPQALRFFTGTVVDCRAWEQGRYHPTPTIVEAARSLYAGHAVGEISRNDAGATNLAVTSQRLSEIIEQTRQTGGKAICLVTGVPGAGKTLVGLDIASRHNRINDQLYSIFLSGNGPLVSVLHEALARDRCERAHRQNETLRLGEARSAVKQFIQNVHHFRDDCLAHLSAPIEHVALFDEAQRAWDLNQTARFMQQKKHRPGFKQSEPEYLISCLDRHRDWAVIVCLVGSGQEINTGEGGIHEWLAAVLRAFPDWSVHLSPQLQEAEYHVAGDLEALRVRAQVYWDPTLHLAASIRSFRSERVAGFVNRLLALETEEARNTLPQILPRFPIYVTRHLALAKNWLRHQARGTERYGLMVSSQAQRLKPYAIDVRVKVDPVRWFLESREDVRSSYYLEDAATEFQVQGLELDWACVVWDGDLRTDGTDWQYFSFKGKRWERIHKEDRQHYLLNAYRVLLTRARQGMVIVVPEGDPHDPTRDPRFYDPAYGLLTRVGIPELGAEPRPATG
jgi:hypothetical protein